MNSEPEIPTGDHYHIWLGGVLPPDLYDINDVNLLSFIRAGSCKIYLDQKEAMRDLANFGGTRLDYTLGVGFEFRDFETAGTENKEQLNVYGPCLASSGSHLHDAYVVRVYHEKQHGGAFTCQREITKGVSYMATFARPKDCFTHNYHREIMKDLERIKQRP